jgi:hypothetical protein
MGVTEQFAASIDSTKDTRSTVAHSLAILSVRPARKNANVVSNPTLLCDQRQMSSEQKMCNQWRSSGDSKVR